MEVDPIDLAKIIYPHLISDPADGYHDLWPRRKRAPEFPDAVQLANEVLTWLKTDKYQLLQSYGRFRPTTFLGKIEFKVRKQLALNLKKLADIIDYPRKERGEWVEL